MGLRLGLAVLAAMMMIVSAGLFVSDYRVFRFGQTLISLQARAATENALPRPRSGWAQAQMADYCITALKDQVFVLFPQDLQQQANAACSAQADQMLATNPAAGEALAIRAFAHLAQGDDPAQGQADMMASALAAPQLTWLADRRLSVVLAQPETDGAWAAQITKETYILAASQVGLARLARIYTQFPQYHDAIQQGVEQHSELTQRVFVTRVRRALEAGSQVSQ